MISLLVRIRLMIIKMILSLFLRILGKFVEIEDRLIIFSSFNGKTYSDNPRYLFEYMRDDEEFADYHFVWAFKKQKEISGTKSVKLNSLRYYYLLTKAKYWVFNAKMPTYYKKSEQIYLQTWHGTPLKRLGHDIFDNGNTYYRSRLSYKKMLESYDQDSWRWDFLISPNVFASQAFVSAFKIREEKVLEVGYPRVDYLVNSRFDVNIDLIKARYGLPTNKKIILYAPTWRDNSFDVKGYKFQLIVDFHKWKKILGQNTIILFKPHYLISNVYQVPEDLTDFVYLMEANADINDAYLMSDSLITDYSSVFFDYANLNRPIYFYMYDFEEYEQELRGFYLNIPNDLPNDVITREDDLLVKINNEDFDYERLRKFNQKFNLWNDGKACSKVVKRIFNEN